MEASMTRKFLTLLCLAACWHLPLAQAGDTREAKAERLLELVRAETMVVDSLKNLETQLMSNGQRALQGRSVTPEQRQQFDAAQQKMLATLQSQLSWEKIRVIYVQLYSEVYSEEEMDQIIAFLSTPAGQSMINKMPLLMQRAQELTMAELNKTLPAAQRQLRDDIEAIGIFPKQ
jgi:hypothetical protein